MKNLITDSGILLPIPEGTQYRISSPFGNRINPVTGKEHHHDGIDIAVAKGVCVLAPSVGEIIRAEKSNSLGWVVVIQHDNGVITQMAHNNILSISVGDLISQGDIVAYAGSTGRSTGNHIHYEITKDIEYKNFYDRPRDNRVNPLKFLWS